MEQDDVLGEVSFMLTRANDWGVGKDYELITGNGNLQINYAVVRSQTLPTHVYTNQPGPATDLPMPVVAHTDSNNGNLSELPEGYYQEIKMGETLSGAVGVGEFKDYLYIAQTDNAIVTARVEYIQGDIKVTVLGDEKEIGMDTCGINTLFGAYCIIDFVPSKKGRSYIIRVENDSSSYPGSYNLDLTEKDN